MGCKGSSEKKDEVKLLVNAGTYKISTFETEGKVLIRENNGSDAGAIIVIADDANDGEGAGNQYWEVTVDDQQNYTIKAATAEGEMFLTAGAVGESATIQAAGDRQKFKIGESKAGWLTLSLAEGGNALERENDGMDAGTTITVAEALGDVGMTGEQRFKFIAVNQAVAAEEEKEAEAEAEAEKVEEEAKEEAEKVAEEAKEAEEKAEEEAKEAEEKAEEEAKEEAKEAEEKAEEEAKAEEEKAEEEAKKEENAIEGALGF